MLKILIGIVIGGAIGSAMGYYGKCTTGACPLTATPIRGGLYGAFMGVLFASMLGGATPEKVSPAVREAGAKAVVHVAGAGEYDRLLAQSKPVLVDLYSDSCPPCRALAPTIDKLAHDYDGRAVIAKINVDNTPELARKLGVSSIPTVVIYHDGKEIKRLVGLKSSGKYAGILDDLIGPNQETTSTGPVEATE